jgi:hypothetical protein
VRTAGDELDRLQQIAQAAPPTTDKQRETTSWSIPVDPGEWAKVPCWRSRGHWQDTLLDLQLEHDPAWLEARAIWKMAARTVAAVGYVLAEAADGKTGRHVTLSYDTIRARVLANTENSPGRTIRLTDNSSVRKCVDMLIHVGLLRRMATGRNFLSKEEKAEAFHTHGGHQNAAANVFACTLPQHLAATPAAARQPTEPAPTGTAAAAPAQPVQNPGCTDTISALSTFPTVKPSSPVNSDHLTPRGFERATRAQPQQKRVIREDASGYVPEMGRSLERHILIGKLDQWAFGAFTAPRTGKRGQLLRTHIGQVEHILTKAGIDVDAWAWWQIAEQIERAYATDKLTAAERIAASGDPLAYFAWMIHHTIPAGDQPRTIIPATPLNPAYQPPTRPAPLPVAPTRSAAELAADQQAADATIQRIRDEESTRRDARRQQLRVQRRALTDVLLGHGKHPADFPSTVRDLHSQIQALHEHLTGHGWTLDQDELNAGEIRWTDETSRLPHPASKEIADVTAIRFITPQTAAATHHYQLEQAGVPLTYPRLSISQLHTALARRAR